MDPPSITKAPIISSSFRATFSFLTCEVIHVPQTIECNLRVVDQLQGSVFVDDRNNDKKEALIKHEDPIVDQLD